MGISGLTSFMDREYLSKVLQEIKLRNCLLLVDGYSLLHQVHSMHTHHSAHGGNYDEFANKLSEFLETFKKCNIELIFLLDGGRDKLDRKFPTSLKRATQRLNDSCSLNRCATPTNNNNQPKKTAKISKINLESLYNSGSFRVFYQLMPIMSFKIFFYLLKKYEILHFQCCFEADYDLACLANELKCPLLSCDSDFYIYNLKYGYISFDFFRIEEIQDETNDKSFYIPAMIYKIDNFIEYFNSHLDNSEEFSLTKEALCIFAALLGNDYVNKTTFNSLWSTFDSTNNNLKFKRLKRNSAGFAKRKNNSFHRMLDWLTQFKSTNECVEMILQFVKSDKHDDIRRIVDESVKEYMCLKPSSAGYFKSLIDRKLEFQFNNLSLNEIQFNFKSDVTTFDGRLISEQFLKEFFECKLSRFCMDILIHRKIIFNCQVEVSHWPSSYLSSSDIRKFYYTMLIKKFDTNLNDCDKQVVIKEYLRYQQDIKIFELNLNDSSNQFLNLDVSSIDFSFVLSKLLKFDDFICKNIISNSIISKKLRFLFIILYYWLYQTSKQNQGLEEINLLKNANFTRAFIVSFIRSSIVEPCFSTAKTLIPESTTSESSARTYENAEDFLTSSYFSTSQDTGKDFLFEFKNSKILSNSSNIDYIKEVRNKLVSFSIPINPSQSFVNKNSVGRIEKLLNLKVVHLLCEFQAIYLSLGYVQYLANLIQANLGDELNLLELNYFFNGTFLHNFMEELQHRVNPDLYIEELFGRKSVLKHLYYDLLNFFNRTFFREKIPVEILAPSFTKSQRKNSASKVK